MADIVEHDMAQMHSEFETNFTPKKWRERHATEWLFLWLGL